MVEDQRLEALRRRRKMAEMLMGKGVDASPVRHPLEALARVFQAYVGGKMGEEADQGMKDYEVSRTTALSDVLSQYDKLSRGSPGISPLTPNDDEGFPMPGVPATPPDPRAANMALVGSGMPMLQQFGIQSLLKTASPGDPFTLKPGETRFGPDGKPIVALPVEQKKEGPKIGDRRERYDGPRIIQEEYTPEGWKSFGQGPRFNEKPTAVVNVNGPKEEFKNEKTLRDEFTEASKSFVKVRDAVSQVKDALAGEITAPATLAAATKFMKILDPESVVRESELQMALKSTGMLDRFLNLHNTIAKGQVLTPTQVKEIQRIAQTLYQTAEGQQQKLGAYYTKLANEYKLNPARIVRDLGMPGGDGLTPAERAELEELRARFRK